MLLRWFIVLLALVVSAGNLDAQPQADTPAIVSGTLTDPLGAPAENTTITIVALDSAAAADTKTDAMGRFSFPSLAGGRYLLKAPTSDAITPSTLTLEPGQRASIDARLVVEEVAVLMRVCRECKPTDYKLNETIRSASGGQRDGDSAIVQPAEPAEGWVAFNERALPYPAAMARSRLEGTVAIDGLVSTDGSSSGLQVVSSTDQRLTDIALPLLQAQRWRPAHVRGMAVAVPLHVTVEFSLYGD